MSNTSENLQATRRGFLTTVTAISAASYNRILGANDRVGIGFIGFGLIGKQHVGGFKTYNDVEILGMCDVYKPRVQEGLAYIGNPNCKGYSDFRKMYEDKNIHGVVVATPDHWHALLTIMACAAGKDVYVEKPLTVANNEGKWMLQAQEKFKRIVVAGTQRRHNRNVAEAKKTVESGVLGKIHMARLGSTRNIYPGFGKTPVENPPADLDYEMWLGPAPKKPYQAHRALYHFRWFWDYSGGQMTNLGAHSIDQLQYIMGVKGPTLVASTGGRFVLEDDGETPDVQDAWFLYPPSKLAPNGWVLAFTMREANAYRDTTGGVIMGTKGNLLTGSNEVVSEMRGDPVNQIPRFLGHPIGGPVYTETRSTPWIEGAATSATAGRGAGAGGARGAGGAAPAGEAGRGAARGAGGAAGSGAPAGFPGEAAMYLNHRDFVNSIRTRAKPLCDLESAHRVAITCNLANMSLRLGGRAIRWDPEKEVVIGDKEAAAMCTRDYRAPWDKELRSIVKV